MAAPQDPDQDPAGLAAPQQVSPDPSPDAAEPPSAEEADWLDSLDDDDLASPEWRG